MYKISDFSKKTGISIETLRYYDKIDFFKPLYTDIFSGYRYYIESQAEDMKKVQKLKEVGLSLQEISDFIKTKDINILLSKREEFMKKVEEINMIMRDKPNKYEIREADYRKYIEINGTRRATCPAALEIRVGNSYYYVIYKNGDFFDDFDLDKKDSWLGLNNKKYYLDDELMKVVLEKISEVTDLIIFYLLNSEEKLNNLDNTVVNEIKKHYPNIRIEDHIQGKWKFFKYTLDIDDALKSISKE